MAKRRYEKPPIEEVVFAVNFTRDSSWDNTYPGLLSKEIEDILPEKRLLLVLNWRWVELEGNLN